MHSASSTRAAEKRTRFKWSVAKSPVVSRLAIEKNGRLNLAESVTFLSRNNLYVGYFYGFYCQS